MRTRRVLRRTINRFELVEISLLPGGRVGVAGRWIEGDTVYSIFMRRRLKFRPLRETWPLGINISRGYIRYYKSYWRRIYRDNNTGN